MSIAVQVVFDTADPHAQARFWAAALGYDVERLHVRPERLEEEVARLEALGAQRLYETADRGPRTITMADPEGNELCVS